MAVASLKVRCHSPFLLFLSQLEAEFGVPSPQVGVKGKFQRPMIASIRVSVLAVVHSRSLGVCCSFVDELHALVARIGFLFFSVFATGQSVRPEGRTRTDYES